MGSAFGIPDFMRPAKPPVCESTGCYKSVLADSKLCIDCEVDEALPRVYAQAEAATK